MKIDGAGIYKQRNGSFAQVYGPCTKNRLTWRGQGGNGVFYIWHTDGSLLNTGKETGLDLVEQVDSFEKPEGDFLAAVMASPKGGSWRDSEADNRIPQRIVLASFDLAGETLAFAAFPDALAHARDAVGGHTIMQEEDYAGAFERYGACTVKGMSSAESVKLERKELR